MEYSFTDIFDIPSLTRLCENYTRTNGIVTALLDLEGTVHVQSGWQDICTKFHRVNPVSAQRCTESDTALAGHLASGKPYNVYRCKNGLVDVAVPVIIDGQHIANFFTGQFFFEPPKKEKFIKQGKELGYELIPYVNALDRVPIFTEEEVKRIMDFLLCLAEIIGEMGKAKLDLLKSRESEQEKVIELKAVTAQLEKLASEDPLTELYNRRKFTALLDQEISRAKRYQHPLSLAMIDADFFKTINDTHGHSAGDCVLKEIAKNLKNFVRSSDIVARLGGDEFCIIFPETEIADAFEVTCKINKSIAETEFSECAPPFNLSCSIGLTSLTLPDNGNKSAEQLLIESDKALYLAKAKGRNCVVNYCSTSDLPEMVLRSSLPNLSNSQPREQTLRND